MNTSDILKFNENQILLAARMVREYYYPKNDQKLADWILVFAVRDLLEMLPETSLEDLFDLLIAQSKVKSQGHLSRYLAASITGNLNIGAADAEVSVFTGARKFSFEKISAMTAYITNRGQNICKTKLNKLLFYSDFVNYFLYGYSISGSKYVRGGFGPEFYRYENMLKVLFFTGVVHMKNFSSNENEIVSRDKSWADKLSVLETVTLHWVLSNYGSMTALELVEYSQSESAHRFTRQEDYIAYEYSKMLQNLPEKSML